MGAPLRQCSKACNCDNGPDPVADFVCHWHCTQDHFPSWYQSMLACRADCSSDDSISPECFSACSYEAAVPSATKPWYEMLTDRNRCLSGCFARHPFDREALRACVGACFTTDMAADRDKHLQRAQEFWVQQKCARQCGADRVR